MCKKNSKEEIVEKNKKYQIKKREGDDENQNENEIVSSRAELIKS